MNSGILCGVLEAAQPSADIDDKVTTAYAKSRPTWMNFYWKSSPGHVASAHAIGVHNTLAVHVVYGTKPVTAFTMTMFTDRAFPSIRYINVYQWCLNSGGKSVPLSVYSHTGDPKVPHALGICCNCASLHAMMWLHANEITKVDTYCDYIYNNDPDVLLWIFEQGIICCANAMVDVAIKYSNLESIDRVLNTYCIPLYTSVNAMQALSYTSRWAILNSLPTPNLSKYFRGVIDGYTRFRL